MDYLVERDQKGYHLTVDGNGVTKLRIPMGAYKKDPSFKEFLGFFRAVAGIVPVYQSSTVRGRLFIQKDMLKITMYNCNKSVGTTIVYNRVDKTYTVNEALLKWR